MTPRDEVWKMGIHPQAVEDGDTNRKQNLRKDR
jgi:hypothetical protein